MLLTSSYWIKTKQSQSNKFKEFAKTSNFWFWKKKHATQLSKKLLDKMCRSGKYCRRYRADTILSTDGKTDIKSVCMKFVLGQLDYFWPRHGKFSIWPWKFKVKVKAKVKPDGSIWGLKFNRYFWFSFSGNWTIFGTDKTNSIFDLENSSSRSWPRSNPIVPFEA